MEEYLGLGPRFTCGILGADGAGLGLHCQTEMAPSQASNVLHKSLLATGTRGVSQLLGRKRPLKFQPLILVWRGPV